MEKYVGTARDTLDLGDTTVEVVRGESYQLDPNHPEVDRALRAGTLERDRSKDEPSKNLEESPKPKAEGRKPKTVGGDA